MDKTMKVDQTGRLLGFIKDLTHNRTTWIILGSFLYFMGWVKPWYESYGLGEMSIGFYWAYDTVSMLTGLVMLFTIPFIIFGIYKLKFPINFALWCSIWIMVFILFVPDLRWDPYIKAYIYPLIYFGLRYSYDLLTISLFIIFLPFWLVIRQPALLRKFRLLTTIVLGIWGAASVVAYIYVLKSVRTSVLDQGQSYAGIGLPLILAGIGVWLVVEIVDQAGRLLGFIKGLTHKRTTWIILGSFLYSMGWDSIWFVFGVLFMPSAGLYFTYYSLFHIIMTIGVIPLVIYAIHKLKSPINRILWYSVWIIAFLYFIPGILWVPIIRAFSKPYLYPLSFLAPGGNLIIFLMINASVIIIPFGLMLRPPELRRGLHLVSVFVLSIWGVADCVDLFFTFQASVIILIKEAVDSITEMRWGLPLILAGIGVWLVVEILEWRSQKPEDATSTSISV